jgi:AraC-like DNA-binding protein
MGIHRGAAAPPKPPGPVRFHFRRPRRLWGLVEGIWEQAVEGTQAWRILPSGSVELIFRLGPAFTLDRARRLRVDAPSIQGPCFLSGLHTQPLDLSFERLHVFGIRLHPVAVRALLGIPTSEVLDGAIEGGLLVPDVERVLEALHGAPDFDSRGRWIEEDLIERLTRAEHLVSAIRMKGIAGQLVASGTEPIGRVVEALGYSRSHAHRLCVEWLGLSPAEFRRLHRFVAATRSLHLASASLTEVGYRAGYFDQAHFIRSFRAFSGMTPGEYQSKSSDALGQVQL